jgi:hypothetical protein
MSNGLVPPSAWPFTALTSGSGASTGRGR